jgi:phenylacetate-CoA ligase
VASGASPAETFLGVLLQTERASEAELNAYQTELLTRLVRHAFTTVPFFAGRGAPPERMDPRSAAWRTQPFMSRSDLTQHANALKPQDFPRIHGQISTTQTGGSTGPAARRDISTLESLGRFGASFRMFQAWDLDQSLDLIWLRKPRPSQDHSYDRWGFPWRPEDKLGRRHAMDIAAPSDRQLDLINRHAPAHVHTLPSNVLRLVMEARRSGTRTAIPTFMVVGEYLAPEVRQAAHDTFGARVIDVFSSAEGGVIAIQCPDSGLYHIQSEIILAEILRSDGEPAAPGETGELVVTPLYSYATPIIRYRTGDFVEAGPPCSCGRCLPTIARIVGRREHMFLFPDGTRALPAIDRIALSQALGHDQWVLVQTDERAAEIRVAGSVSPEQQDILLRHVQASLGSDFAASLARVDALPLTSGSKRHFTVNATGR